MRCGGEALPSPGGRTAAPRPAPPSVTSKATGLRSLTPLLAPAVVHRHGAVAAVVDPIIGADRFEWTGPCPSSSSYAGTAATNSRRRRAAAIPPSARAATRRNSPRSSRSSVPHVSAARPTRLRCPPPALPPLWSPGRTGCMRLRRSTTNPPAASMDRAAIIDALSARLAEHGPSSVCAYLVGGVAFCATACSSTTVTAAPASASRRGCATSTSMSHPACTGTGA